jgi:cupin 2 domain-containing protein
MTTNLFADIPPSLPEELVQVLTAAPGVRIERIVSHGHASPPAFWYDQDEAEWVTVVRGVARLRFEDGAVEMRPGDHVTIPARRRHRVEWTSPDEPTVWLAVFYREEVGRPPAQPPLHAAEEHAPHQPRH